MKKEERGEIRKLSISQGSTYDSGMHYQVGSNYSGGKCYNIIDRGNFYEIYLEINKEVRLWKEVNKKNPIVIEYFSRDEDL